MRMRRLMALALAGCVTVSVTACGGSGDTATTAPGTAAADTVAAADTEAATDQAAGDSAAEGSSKGLTPEEKAEIYDFARKNGYTLLELLKKGIESVKK